MSKKESSKKSQAKKTRKEVSKAKKKSKSGARKKKTRREVPKPSLFAVVQTGGKQYKVEEGSVIKVDRIEEKEGKEIEFKNILLLVCKDNVKIGTPFVSGAHIKAKITVQARDKKIIVFKYKPKKRYRKTYGHKQYFTELEIKKIITK